MFILCALACCVCVCIHVCVFHHQVIFLQSKRHAAYLNGMLIYDIFLLEHSFALIIKIEYAMIVMIVMLADARTLWGESTRVSYM